MPTKKELPSHPNNRAPGDKTYLRGRVKSIMKRYGLSMSELAAMADCDRAIIAMFLNGRRKIDSDKVSLLMDGLGARIYTDEEIQELNGDGSSRGRKLSSVTALDFLNSPHATDIMTPCLASSMTKKALSVLEQEAKEPSSET
ncbi:MAG: helix-turn-helix transcriptional regulator [Bacteroidetes bacterium]|nr:helix-turn-helix transcriptional regulator [Bacteroidota bacterium]